MQNCPCVKADRCLFSRFGKVIYINQKEKSVHVQWYEHSSKTYLEDVSNSQELFLCPQFCGTIPLWSVLGKATVHHEYSPASGEVLDPLHYFCRFVQSSPSSTVIILMALLSFHYDETHGAFTDLDVGAGDILDPPDNCPACLLDVQNANDKEPVIIKDGLSYLGQVYHHHDYALIAEVEAQAPASIGMIVRIRPGKKHEASSTLIITVRLLGRMVDLLSEESLGSAALADKCADEVERKQLPVSYLR